MTTIPLTWLYAPGDRPQVVEKALSAGADVVIVDLEDAVAPNRKEYARAATAELLAEPLSTPVHVRVATEADVLAVAGLPGLSGLRLPKVTDALQVQRVAGLAPGVGLHPLLESALGVEHAYVIARAHDAVRGIALGEADLCADLGVRNESGLDWARSRVVVAARAAGLAPPVQSVYRHISDLAGLAASCAHGRSLGFLGRAAIHPAQLPVIERAYLPPAVEVAAAEEVLSASPTETGALALADGRFVDAAVVEAARRTLALSGRDAPTPPVP
ncbi:CoA ester lyase [Streptomyces crystallinus]|uniref:CoA ester lyase n=1 Tax=Streptomyces crystallinus TaxID=68191 RepID=A0ABP3S146_9ACTN